MKVGVRISKIFCIFVFCFLSVLNASEKYIDPTQIYAFGLTYASHIEESGEKVDREKGPPIFRKEGASLFPKSAGNVVTIPTQEEIYTSLQRFNDPRMIRKLKKKFSSGFPIMFDYEVELGFVLLEDISKNDLRDPDFSPKFGQFISNDLSMRSVQILGEKQRDKYEYWTLAKSYNDFLPIGEVKIPEEPFKLNEWPDLTIECTVNGELRQSAQLRDMAYSPKELLEYLMRYNSTDILRRGTTFLTGTPAGVAFKVNKFKKLLAKIFFLSRYTMLKISAKDAKENPLYLKAGQKVRVSIPGVDFREVVVR